MHILGLISYFGTFAGVKYFKNIIIQTFKEISRKLHDLNLNKLCHEKVLIGTETCKYSLKKD